MAYQDQSYFVTSYKKIAYCYCCKEKFLLRYCCSFEHYFGFSIHLSFCPFVHYDPFLFDPPVEFDFILIQAHFLIRLGLNYLRKRLGRRGFHQ